MRLPRVGLSPKDLLSLTVLFAVTASLTVATFAKPAKVTPPPSQNVTEKQVKNEVLGITTGELVQSAEVSFAEYVSPPVSRTYKYCLKLKNVSESYLPELRQSLTDVYSDVRGWSLGGVIRFTEVGSGCHFNVWLSAAADLPSFHPVCSTFYSCYALGNVVINFDRWSQGSPAWHGPLPDYRSLVINHETGHFLGFGHPGCGGVGQPAPVMQQQSISLSGCVENSWPLLWERQNLAKRYGIKLTN